MAKKTYLPSSDADKVLWLNNFSAKFTPLAVSLGFVAADATAVTNDAAMFAYLMGTVENFTTAKEQRVEYKNLIKDGPIGSVGGAVPSGPAVPAAPTVVAPGVFPRISQMVQRIKNHPAYTEAIGRDLGIIGAEETIAAVMKMTAADDEVLPLFHIDAGGIAGPCGQAASPGKAVRRVRRAKLQILNHDPARHRVGRVVGAADFNQTAILRPEIELGAGRA